LPHPPVTKPTPFETAESPDAAISKGVGSMHFRFHVPHIVWMAASNVFIFLSRVRGGYPGITLFLDRSTSIAQ
jgi:hypothetical protein